MNAPELKAEIARLQELGKMQSAALLARVSSAKAIFTLLFPKACWQDDLRKISAALLPLAVNKLFFRNSGAIIRALSAHLTGNLMTEQSIGGLLKKIRNGSNKNKSTVNSGRAAGGGGGA